MANRRDFYYRQKVTEAELDGAFDAMEVADRNIVADHGLIGVVSNAVVSAHSPVANLTVDVSAPAIIYDQTGQRIFIASLQVVDVSTDSNGSSTTVTIGGQEKIVSVFAKFKRTLSDQRTDGNGATVYFLVEESFEIIRTQGAQGAPPATPPALQSDAILLADIRRSNGQTQILAADITPPGGSYAGITNRREDAFVVDSAPLAIRRGHAEDAISDVALRYNQHVNGAADKHPAADVNWAGGAAWFDGTTNPAASAEVQLDKIITDLVDSAGTNSGAHKLGCDARTTWLGGRTNPSGVSIFAAIDKIITDLAVAAAGDDGAERIGAEAVSGFSAGSVRSQLTELGPAVAGTAHTAAKTFNGATGDTNAAFLTTAAITTRKLLWEINSGTSSQKIRLYTGPSGGNARLEITLNAQWNGTDWTRDSTGTDSVRYTFGPIAFTMETKAAGAGTFSSFDETMSLTPVDGLFAHAGTMDGVVGFAGHVGGAGQLFGDATTFRAKFTSAPTSVTYSNTGMPADVNVTTAFAQANTTFTTSGIFVTGAATAAANTVHARSYSVS
jgi:hypothetical protein